MIYRQADGFTTREEDSTKYIEGYFAVFNSPYIFDEDGDYETIAPGAFDASLANGDDIRALINHDTTLVIGRTVSNTLELHTDEHGLFGRIAINTNDSEAVNIWERVRRGDVSQCSFGFEILAEETITEQGNKVHFIIKEVRLFEVSVCTFPAYEATKVIARSETDGHRALEAWKIRTLAKLNGGAENGTENT